MSTGESATPRKRGRPPNEDAQRRVLAAARQLMTEGGVAAVTVEALSALAGVTRPTIYRHWPNAQAVAMAALMDDETRRPPRKASKTLAKDLEAELTAVAEALASPTGRSALALVASADPSTELAKAFRHHLLLKSRERVRTRLQLAVDQAELSGDCDVDCLADLVLAPMFFRLLVGHAPVSPAFARTCVRHLIRENAMPAPRARRPRIDTRSPGNR